MSRNSVLVLMIALIVTAASAQQQPVQRVETALDHLTVIEASEPITMVAAGSDAFEIERHGHRVFIKPTKTGVSTNLFVWTEHGRSVYELDPAGEVKQMDVLIGAAAQYSATGSAGTPAADGGANTGRILSDTLLNAQTVKGVNLKTRRNRVNVELDGVVRDKDEIYVRYKITNLTSVPYRIAEPQVTVITGTKTPGIVIGSNTQVGNRYLSHLGSLTTTSVPVLRSEVSERDIAPGHTATGVLSVRKSIESSQVFQFSFGSDAKAPVTAIGVL